MTILHRISRSLFFSTRLLATNVTDIRPVAIKASQKDEIVQFIAHYYNQTDPIAKALELEPREVITFYSDLFDHFIKKPVSFAFYTPEDRMAGVKLNSIVDFNEKDPLLKVTLAKYPMRVLSFLHLTENFATKLPVLAPNVKKWLCFEIVSVHPDHRSKELLHKMWDLSLAKATEVGCHGAYSICKSEHAQQYLAKELGFRTLKTLKYWDYKSLDGKKIFEHITVPDSVKLMAKTW